MESQHEANPEQSIDRANFDVEALYLEHKDAMWGTALKLLRGDQDRAKDAVQTVMVKIISKPSTDVRNWEAFLVTAVKRTIQDWWKSAAHKHEQFLIDGDAPLKGVWLGDDTLGMDPAHLLDQTEERLATNAEAREALAELRAGYPDAHYAYVQVKGVGRTSKDVAAELGVSDSRVRQHVMKARSELRKILDARGGER